MKLFCSMIDRQLLGQMKDLIRRTANENSYGRLSEWNCLLKEKEVKSRMEEQYNLKYPGEVLERYEERCGGGKSQTMALALALAETKPVLDQAMFVGTQYTDFIRKVRQQAEEDFFLCCILYLLTDSAEEETRLYDRISGRAYAGIQEMVFAVYTFQSRRDAWEIIKKHGAAFMGKERDYHVYENIQLYIWILKQFHKQIRKYRGRGISVLKALLELACGYVKKDTVIWNRLLEEGYSEQEILYLNISLPQKLNLTTSLTEKSITMERMALAGVKEILNAEVIEDAGLFRLCRRLIRQYQSYYIYLEGKKGIVESLGQDIRIKNPELFQYLYKKNAEDKLPVSWFYADFGMQEWCDVHSWMETEQFTQLFGASMLAHNGSNIDSWLDNYRERTGKSYHEIFWKSDEYTVRSIFQLYIQKNKVDLKALLNEYSEDEKKLTEEELGAKWSVMKSNISSAVCGLDTHEAYLFWEAFDDWYGISQLDTFLMHSNTVLNAVGIRTYGQYFQRMDFKKHIFTASEQARVFGWVEQEVYQKLPKYYEEFLYAFLMLDSAEEIFPEESRKLFLMIKESVKGGDKYSLCRKYYTKEEWQLFLEKEEEKKAEQKRKQKQADLEAFQKEVYQKIQEAEKECDVLESIIQMMPYLRLHTEKMSICLELLRERMQPVGYAKRNTIVMLADKLFFQFLHKKIGLKEVLSILGKMEVLEDESTEN